MGFGPPKPTAALEWRNWQTHGTQNPAPFTGHVGSTPTSSTRPRAPHFELGSRLPPVEFGQKLRDHPVFFLHRRKPLHARAFQCRGPLMLFVDSRHGSLQLTPGFSERILMNFQFGTELSNHFF